MTVKAGQKCTAIRRVIVPESIADAVTDAISAKLAKITVGNPTSEGVRMGALASSTSAKRSARPSRPSRHQPTSSSATPTASISSTRTPRRAPSCHQFCSARTGATEPHNIEPFGPVATVLTYNGLDEAIALAARGAGSLVGSLITHDPAVARTVTLGLAPWHGRILILDRDDAAESTGHGSPLPVLVHGDPGRAGGGEELGGIRGVLHHMQRTAVDDRDHRTMG